MKFACGIRRGHYLIEQVTADKVIDVAPDEIGFGNCAVNRVFKHLAFGAFKRVLPKHIVVQRKVKHSVVNAVVFLGTCNRVPLGDVTVRERQRAIVVILHFAHLTRCEKSRRQQATTWQ